MLNQMGLGIMLTVKDMASGVIEKVRGEFEKLGEGAGAAGGRMDASLGQFAKGAAMLGAGVTILKTTFSLAEAAAPFETSMSTVAYRTQASAEEMRGLRDAAIDASASLKIVSETDAARAMAAFAEGGNSAKDSMTALVPILQFAKANQMDVAEAAGFADNMMDQYGVTAEQVGEKFDKAQWVMRSFGLNAQELGNLFGPLAAQAKLTAQSFDDMLLVLGAATTVSGPRMAMMGLRTAMQQISDPEFKTKMAANFKGISVEGEGGKLRALPDILSDIAARMDTMTEKDRANALKEVFGGKGAGGLVGILDSIRNGVTTTSGAVYKGADALRALNGEMQNSAGEVDLALAAMSPYDLAAQEAAASWSNLKRTLGEAFLPPLAVALKGISTAVNWIRKKIADLPAPVREFLGVFFPVLGGLLTAVGVIKMIAGAIGIAKAAMIAFGIAANASTGGLLLAVGAIAVALTFLIKDWDKWKETAKIVASAIGGAFGWLADKIGKAWDWISDRWMRFIDTLHGAIVKTIDWVGGLPARVWDTIKRIGTSVWKFFTETIPAAVRVAATAVKDFVLDIPVVGHALKGIGVAADWIYEGVGDVARDVVGGMQVASGNPSAPTARPTTTMASPGIAAVTAATAAASRPTAPPERPSGSRATTTREDIHVHMNIDGREFTEIVDSRIRERTALGFGAVPEEV